jgi:hypothetical protein
VLRHLDILGLGAFVTTAQQDDDRISALLEIDAVAGAVMDTELADSSSDQLDIAEMALGETIQPREDQASGAPISESHSPFSERFSLFDIEHDCSS